MGCGMLIVGGDWGRPRDARDGGGSGSWQGLGWWDDGGEGEDPDTRHRIYSKFTKSASKPSHPPDRTNGKTYIYIPSLFIISFKIWSGAGANFPIFAPNPSLYPPHRTRGHGDKRSSDCDRNIWDASIFTADSQPGAGAGDSETMKIVFWFNLALHRIQLGRYKLICPCSLNSIFLFISTLHISNRLDLRICLAWLPVRERRGSNPADTIKCEGPGGSMQ